MPVEQTKLNEEQLDRGKLMDMVSKICDENDDFNLPNIDYPDRYLVNGREIPPVGYTRIGDTVLPCPPTGIKVLTQNEMYDFPTIRASTAQTIVTGKCDKTILINLMFSDLEDILLLEDNVPFYNPENDANEVKRMVHPNTLRALIAQFRRTPFVPIINETLNDYGITAVALLQLDVETVPDFPHSLKATLVCVPFDYHVHLPSSMRFEEWIIWPIWRWYWRQEWLKSAKMNSQYIDSWTSDFKFYTVSERILKERQYVRQNIDLSKSKAYEITEEDLAANMELYDPLKSADGVSSIYDSLTATGIRVTFTNEFSAMGLLNAEAHSLQFLGGGNTEVIVTGYCSRDTSVALNNLMVNMRSIVRQYHFEIVSGFLGVSNDLLQAFGLFEFIPTNCMLSTVEQQPELRSFQMSLSQFNKLQASYEQFTRVRNILKGKYDSIDSAINLETMVQNIYTLQQTAFSNTSITALSQLMGKGDLLSSVSSRVLLDNAGKGPFTDSGFIQVAHEAMQVMELYPDLALPNMEYFIRSLPSISMDYDKHNKEYNKAKGFNVESDKLVTVQYGSNAVVDADTDMFGAESQDASGINVNSGNYKNNRSYIETVIDSLGMSAGIIEPMIFYNGGYYVDPDFYMQRLPYNPLAEVMMDVAKDNTQQYLIDKHKNKYIGKFRMPSTDEDLKNRGVSNTLMSDLLMMQGDQEGLTPIDAYSMASERFMNIESAIADFRSGELFGKINSAGCLAAVEQHNDEKLLALRVIDPPNAKERNDGRKYDPATGWLDCKPVIVDYIVKTYHETDPKGAIYTKQNATNFLDHITKDNNAGLVAPPAAYAIAEALHDWDISKEKEILAFIKAYNNNLQELEADPGWLKRLGKQISQDELGSMFIPDTPEDPAQRNPIYAFYKTLLEMPTSNKANVTGSTLVYDSFSVSGVRTAPVVNNQSPWIESYNVSLSETLYGTPLPDGTADTMLQASSLPYSQVVDQTASDGSVMVWPKMKQEGLNKIYTFCESLYLYSKLYAEYERELNGNYINATNVNAKQQNTTTSTPSVIKNGTVTKPTQFGPTIDAAKQNDIVVRFNKTIGLPDNFPTLALIAGLNQAEHGGNSEWSKLHINRIPTYNPSSPASDADYPSDINAGWHFGPLQLKYEHIFDNDTGSTYTLATNTYGNHNSKMLFPDSDGLLKSNYNQIWDAYYKEYGPTRDTWYSNSSMMTAERAPLHQEFMNTLLSHPRFYMYACLQLIDEKARMIGSFSGDVETDMSSFAERWLGGYDSTYVNRVLNAYRNNVSLPSNIQTEVLAAMDAYAGKGLYSAGNFSGSSNQGSSTLKDQDLLEDKPPENLNIDELVRKGSPYDYSNVYQNFWGHYTDMLSHGNYGRLLGAFPSFCIIFLDEGMERWYTKFQPIFNRHAGATDIAIKRSIKNPIDVCKIDFSNAYRSLSSYVGDQYLANMAYRENFFYTCMASIPFFDPLKVKRRMGEVTYTKRDEDVGAVMIRAGVRIHVRMGYGSNAMLLPVAFNGTVAETSPPGNIFSILAHGDGVEFSNKLPVFDDLQSLEPASWLGWEPRELICHMMMSSGDQFGGLNAYIWRIIKNHLGGITRGRFFAKNPLGITHFGKPLFVDAEDINANPSDQMDIVTRQAGIVKSSGALVDWLTKAIGAPAAAFTSKTPYIPTVHGNIMHDPEAYIKFKQQNSIKITPPETNISPGQAIVGGTLAVGVTAALVFTATWPFIGPPLAILGGLAAIGFSILANSNILHATCIQTTGEIGENVYSTTGYEKPDCRTNPQLGFLHHPKLGLDMFIYDKTPWDVFKLCADANPNYAVGVRPFEFRSTLFFGQPYYTYRYTYKRIGIDDIYNNPDLAKHFGIPIFYMSKTFSQMHMAHSSLNLYDNDLRATEEKMCNQIVARWFKQPGTKADTNILAETQYVSKRIFPERRKTYIVDTNFVGLSWTRGWLAAIVQFVLLPLQFLIPLKYALNEYINFFYNRDHARMIARSLLRDYVREMYQGDITVAGDATIWPHDKMYLNDDYNEMKGLTVVREVNIHFSRATGFTNVVELAPYAYVKGDKKVLENTVHARLIGSAATWLGSAIANWRLAATGCNAINSLMFKNLGYLSYIGIYNSRTMYYRMLQIIGEKMIDFQKDPLVFMREYQKITQVSAMGAETEQFMAKEIFAKVNSKYTTSKIINHNALQGDDVLNSVIKLIKADGVAAIKASEQVTDTYAGKILISFGRKDLQGVLTKEIVEESINVLNAGRAAKVAGIGLGVEVGGVAEKALLGQFLGMMSKGALTRLIVKAAFRGPCTLAWTALGGLFGPVGMFFGNLIGWVGDAILFHVLVSVPFTMFNRYFDDAYSLEMSLLTYRGREFSAGINGHRLNTGVVYTIPRDVSQLEYDIIYKDKQEAELGERMNILAQNSGDALFNAAISQGYLPAGELNSGLLVAAKSMVGKQYPLSGYFCAPAVCDMLSQMGITSDMIKGAMTMGGNNPNWVPDWFTSKDMFSTTIGEDKSLWQPGDIILFRDQKYGSGDGTPYGMNWKHIAVYAGNNQIIHCSSSHSNQVILGNCYGENKVIAIRLDPSKFGNLNIFNNGGLR